MRYTRGGKLAPSFFTLMKPSIIFLKKIVFFSFQSTLL
jgi:hypothetical protein